MDQPVTLTAIEQLVERIVQRTVERTVQKATAHLATKSDVQSVKSGLDQLTTELQKTDSRLSNEIHIVASELQKTERRLNQRLDTMQAAVIETISNVNDAHDVHFNEHERRLKVLERFAAL